MANLTDVAVTAEKNLPVNDDSCTWTPMQTNQNGVLTVAGCTEIVLSQRQTADIVTDKAGDFEFCFQCIDSFPVADADMRHIAHDAFVRINQAWEDHRDGYQLADFALV